MSRWQQEIAIEPGGVTRERFHKYDDRGCFMYSLDVLPYGSPVSEIVVTLAGARVCGVSVSHGRQYEGDELRPRPESFAPRLPEDGFVHLSAMAERAVDEAWGQMVANTLDPPVEQPGRPFTHTLSLAPAEPRGWRARLRRWLRRS